MTRAEYETALDDVRGERAELRKKLAELDEAEREILSMLDGFCRAKCDHGHGCSLPRHHPEPDRHETGHCVFYDSLPVSPEHAADITREACAQMARHSAPSSATPSEEAR